MLVHVVDATGRSDRDGNALGGHETGKYQYDLVIDLMRGKVRVEAYIIRGTGSGSGLSP